MIHSNRIYDEPGDDDGFRILVDRLWPRGVSKERAKIDLWIKEVGPSNELRKWYGHDEEKYDEFKRRYNAELDENPAWEELKSAVAEHRTTTLLHSAKSDLNNASVLLERLQQG